MQSRRTATAALLILAACFVLAQALPTTARAAEAWGEIREATRNLNIRAKRDYKSEHILTLKKGERVKVDYLQDGWYAVFPLDARDRSLKTAIGYSKAKYLKFIAPASTAEPSPGQAPEATAVQPEADNATAAAPAQSAPQAPPMVESVSPAPAPKAPAVTEGETGQKVVAEVEQRPEDLPSKPAASGRPPVRITADKLTYNDKQRTVTFSGNVEATHEELKLWAKDLTAYFDKKGKPGEEIDRIVASGGVRMERGTTQGTCESVTYMVKENLLLMEGDPVIKDGKNTVTGKVVKFYVKENRSEVVGGNGKRVEAILFAPQTLEAP